MKKIHIKEKAKKEMKTINVKRKKVSKKILSRARKSYTKEIKKN